MIKETFCTVKGALFLDDSVFQKIKESEDRIQKVFVLIVVVTLVAGVFSFVGKVGMYYTSPTFDEIEDIWKEPMRTMQKGAPWYEEMPSTMKKSWDDMYDVGWGIAQTIFTVFAPNPVSAFLDMVVTLIIRLIMWVIIGGIFHVCARVLSGTGTFSQTLALTGLGAAPHILEVVEVVPYAVAAGIFAWVLIIFVKGIKVAHNFDNRDTLLCMLLPFLVIFGLIALIAGVL